MDNESENEPWNSRWRFLPPLTDVEIWPPGPSVADPDEEC